MKSRTVWGYQPVTFLVGRAALEHGDDMAMSSAFFKACDRGQRYCSGLVGHGKPITFRFGSIAQGEGDVAGGGGASGVGNSAKSPEWNIPIARSGAPSRATQRSRVSATSSQPLA